MTAFEIFVEHYLIWLRSFILEKEVVSREVSQIGIPRSQRSYHQRLRMINDILFDCLDWDKSDCIAEDRFDGTFIDYGLHHKSGLKLIVEAKKEGISFELPVGFYSF